MIARHSTTILAGVAVTELEGRVGQKGQITLPKELREKWGIKAQDKVRIVPEADGLKVQPGGSRMAKHFGSVEPIRSPEDYTGVRREFEALVAEDAATRGQQQAMARLLDTNILIRRSPVVIRQRLRQHIG